MAATSPRAQALSMASNCLLHRGRAFQRSEQQRLLRVSGSRSKKRSCSSLVSSWPIGLPAAAKRCLSFVSTPSSWLQVHRPELRAEQRKRDRPGLHPVERGGRDAAAGDGGGERGALVRRGTRSSTGGRPGEVASFIMVAANGAGLAVSTMVSTTSPCDSSAARSNAGLTQRVPCGRRWMVPNR
jgi:hypothetical protein